MTPLEEAARFSANAFARSHKNDPRRFETQEVRALQTNPPRPTSPDRVLGEQSAEGHYCGTFRTSLAHFESIYLHSHPLEPTRRPLLRACRLARLAGLLRPGSEPFRGLRGHVIPLAPIQPPSV